MIAAVVALVLTSVPRADAQQRVEPTAMATRGDTILLTLQAARRLALRSNRELAAARLDTAVAAGELRQARTLLSSNPTAEVLSGGAGLGAEPGVSQQIELFNPRGARVSAGRAGVERARAAVADVRRRTLGEVDRAFYRLAAALRRGLLADTVLVLNRRIAEAASRQLQAGEISRLDFNLALIESGRAQSRALAARREATASAIELVRLGGLGAGTTIIPAVDSARERTVAPPSDSVAVPSAGGPGEPHVTLSLNVDSITAVALARRPDIAERAAAARAASALATAARREALPNLVLRGTSETGDAGTRVFRPGVGLTLPVFNLNRGAVAARRAEAQQATLQRIALEASVRAGVRSAVAAYASAAREVEVLGSTVLQPARQNRQLLETAYREGEVGLPVLLLIRNQVIDAELEYWTSWLAEREALANLDEITGQNLIDSGAP